MKRVGALFGAVVMIVAALAVRGTFGGENGDGGGGGDSGGGVVCPTELADACVVVPDSRSERAGTTADALLASDGDALEDEAWIVPAAWARLVIAERERLGLAPLYEIDGEALASSPVTLVVWDGRAEQLASACGRPVDWTCLAERDGSALADGDHVRTGTPSVESATGLGIAAAQAANLLGRSDYATNDFTGSFASLAGRLASGQRDDPVGTMRLQGPGRLTASGTVAADTTNLATNFGTLVTAGDIAPSARIDIVVMVRSGGSLDPGIRRALAESFTEAGWDPPIDEPDGLPSGGVLAAVRTLWNENR